MDLETSLGRIRAQLSGMERMTRILRAEIESQISGFAPGTMEHEDEVSSGLGSLFRAAAPLASLAVDPYGHFAPDVWIGLDHEVTDAGATVAMKALRRPGPGGEGRGVARLSVNPVFPLARKPRWVTLETAVSVEALRQARALRIDTISFFQIGPGNTAEIPRSVTMNLRLHRPGGKTSDHLGHRIPVSTMPFEHAARVSRDTLAEIDLKDVSEATIILELPLAGNYTLHLDHFALLAIDEG
ncbi:hypothetical protein PSM7751_03962 [Pseudooceanicola marinus]|uniref:Uncharacterized protein n=1 Tax=Pseudooceanicola marinus TaxID=396013 RepID=A0A1X7A864_9RHOB|nr:hypothetical protein [Pseudooceanicola marinus]PJE33607.1 hypothetical protein CVM50_00990 [Pseudooceanicola marinus]SLN72833.1 hypothetical protein PSM7751_03962 [Pseudooceanicola marinus]